MEDYENLKQETQRQILKKQLDGARCGIFSLTTAIRISQFILFSLAIVNFVFGIIFCAFAERMEFQDLEEITGCRDRRVVWTTQWSGILLLVTGSLDVLSLFALCCFNRHCFIGIAAVQGMMLMMVIVTAGFLMDMNHGILGSGPGTTTMLILWWSSCPLRMGIVFLLIHTIKVIGQKDKETRSSPRAERGEFDWR